jgi:hypothetical protein
MPTADQLLTLLKVAGPFGGLLGIFFMLGWIVPAPIYRREVARADSWEQLAKTAMENTARLVNTIK